MQNSQSGKRLKEETKYEMERDFAIYDGKRNERQQKRFKYLKS